MVGWDRRKSILLLHWIESVNFGLILGRTFLGRIYKRVRLRGLCSTGASWLCRISRLEVSRTGGLGRY
jgi:hypothetical protein